MSYQIEFEIQSLPHTMNALSHRHWAIKTAEAKTWINRVRLATVGKIPESPLTRAKVTFTRFSSSQPDSDGLVSSFKHVCDGLVHAGIITNDKFENIGMPTYLWEKASPNKGKIRVKVESLMELSGV